MSDVPTSLIEQLADAGVKEIVLPTRVGDLDGQTDSVAQRAINNPQVAALAKEYFDDPARFHGDKMGHDDVMREKAIHRSMIYLHACGVSAKEIAIQTGYTPASVYAVLRQPWAKLRLAQIIDEMGQDRIKSFLSREVSPSLEILVEIRGDPGRPSAYKPADRISATKEILDRALGKSTIHVESKNENTNVPADAAAIDRELKEIRKQLDQKGVSNGSGTN